MKKILISIDEETNIKLELFKKESYGNVSMLIRDLIKNAKLEETLVKCKSDIQDIKQYSPHQDTMEIIKLSLKMFADHWYEQDEKKRSVIKKHSTINEEYL